MIDISQWISILATEQPLIIVEGKKDRASLAKLGIKNIMMLAGKPLHAVVDDVAEKTTSCVLLTDLDPEGRKLYSTLKKQLMLNGIKIDDRFRNFLYRETQLRTIEGINHLATHQEDL